MAIALSIGGFESRILENLLAVTSPVQFWHIVLLLKSWAVLVNLFVPVCSSHDISAHISILQFHAVSIRKNLRPKHAAILLVLPSEFRFSVDSITIFHWKIVSFPANSDIYWLVVDLPLWQIWKSDWIIIPTIGENKTCSKPPLSIVSNDEISFYDFPLVSLGNHQSSFFPTSKIQIIKLQGPFGQGEAVELEVHLACHGEPVVPHRNSGFTHENCDFP